MLSEVKVFRFPTNLDWIAAVKREGWRPTSNSRICSTHFVSGNVKYVFVSELLLLY